MYQFRDKKNCKKRSHTFRALIERTAQLIRDEAKKDYPPYSQLKNLVAQISKLLRKKARRSKKKKFR